MSFVFQRTVARITGRTAGGKWLVASGCAVAGNEKSTLVVTTRHKLFDGSARVSELKVTLEGASCESIAVAWESEACDLAVLRCDNLRAETARIGPVPAGGVRPPAFRAAGYPRAGADADGKRLLVELSGVIYAGDPQVLSIQVGADYPPTTADDWSGASGGPIFVNDIVVAILREVPTRFAGGRLDAIPLDRVYRAYPKLAELLGPLARRTVISVVLPHAYVRREPLVAAALDALAGSARYVAIHGFAGAGKSVLAADLAADVRVQAMFPDGIAWRTLGRDGDPCVWIEDVARDLDIALMSFRDILSGRTALARELGDRRCLIVLDDVWKREDLDALDFLGRGRFLVTTRNADILDPDHTALITIGELSQIEARTSLAAALGVGGGLPAEADELIRQCGRLPFALQLVAAILKRVRGLTPQHWRDLAARFDVALARVDVKLDRVLAYSLDDLCASAPHIADALLRLAVFREDAHVPRSAIEVAWTGLVVDSLDVDQWLAVLVDRSLLQRDDVGAYFMHDLMHDLLRDRQRPIRGRLHADLVAAYRVRRSDAWLTENDDGYFHANIAYHLAACGERAELARLVSREWMEARYRAAGSDYRGFLSDLDTVASAVGDDALLAIRIQAARQLVTEVMLISDELLTAFVDVGRSREAIASADVRYGDKRSRALATIACARARRGESVGEILDLLRDSDDETLNQRDVALVAALAGQLGAAHRYAEDIAQELIRVEHLDAATELAEHVAESSSRITLVARIGVALAQRDPTAGRARIKAAHDAVLQLDETGRYLCLGTVAECYARAGFDDEASRLLPEIEDLFRDDVYLQLALLAVQRGDIDKARALLSSGLLIDAEAKAVRLMWGTAEEQAGLIAEILRAPQHERDRSLRQLVANGLVEIAGQIALRVDWSSEFGNVVSGLSARFPTHAIAVLEHALSAHNKRRLASSGIAAHTLRLAFALIRLRDARAERVAELAESAALRETEKWSHTTSFALARAWHAVDARRGDELFARTCDVIGSEPEDSDARWAAIRDLVAADRLSDALVLTNGSGFHSNQEALTEIVRYHLRHYRCEDALAIWAQLEPSHAETVAPALAIQLMEQGQLDRGLAMLGGVPLEQFVPTLHKVACALVACSNDPEPLLSLVDAEKRILLMLKLAELRCADPRATRTLVERADALATERTPNIACRSVMALGRAGLIDEALARARAISSLPLRARTLLWLAQKTSVDRDMAIREALDATREAIETRANDDWGVVLIVATQFGKLHATEALRELLKLAHGLPYRSSSRRALYVSHIASGLVEIYTLRGDTAIAHAYADVARAANPLFSPCEAIARDLFERSPAMAFALLRPAGLEDLLRTVLDWAEPSPTTLLLEAAAQVIEVATWSGPSSWDAVLSRLSAS